MVKFKEQKMKKKKNYLSYFLWGLFALTLITHLILAVEYLPTLGDFGSIFINVVFGIIQLVIMVLLIWTTKKRKV
jgi:hypothetical protein